MILLTGGDIESEDLRRAGADAVLRKPFSPVELLMLVDKVSHETVSGGGSASGSQDEQLLIYARDLSRVVEVERGQRRLLQHAYRQTVTALADALEAKDRSTGLHGRRVQRYGLELAEAYDASLVADPSLEYGFLLHDVGKIGIPETILRKPGPLDDTERRLMQRHPQLGVDILDGIPLLEGAGLEVVRSHHERWDGTGYPDGLAGEEIPVAARIFALADALDAITTDRPYRKRLSWDTAIDEILGNSSTQFDPGVVAAFALREGRLKQIAAELTDAPREPAHSSALIANATAKPNVVDEPDELAAVVERLRHHRVGEHRQDRPGRERQDERDRRAARVVEERRSRRATTAPERAPRPPRAMSVFCGSSPRASGRSSPRSPPEGWRGTPRPASRR